MATVIIPAHNEASVIRRCLDSLSGQPGITRLIVACNGCSDNTADIVRTEYPNAVCLDIQTPSKVNALNEAEKHVADWPVFYIDADTRLSENTIETITDAMADSGLLLAAPEPEIDVSHSSWPVRQYYRVWLSLPYIRDGVVATCSYVISEQGRQRFTNFPPIINDDGYVRCQFDAAERGNIPGTRIHITAPGNLRSLIKIKTRARLGNMELAAKKLCSRPEHKPYSRILRARLFSRDFIPVTCYILISLAIRLRARNQFKTLASYRWETDQTSRQETAP
ncbi:MAG: glycosyltransferase family 2 protein [Thiothrix sp.]|nr:glycosyltransferase family 2 protein [Thiothrix sp.]HPE59422.1 glycosyltransferase family 2 protein [Thiolinea sp.]